VIRLGVAIKAGQGSEKGKGKREWRRNQAKGDSVLAGNKRYPVSPQSNGVAGECAAIHHVLGRAEQSGRNGGLGRE